MSKTSENLNSKLPIELDNVDGKLFSRLKKEFVCEICAGQNFLIEEDERGYSTKVPCQCAGHTRRIKLLNDAGIPGKFAETQFDTYHPVDDSQRLALRMAKDFVSDFGPEVKGILFMGQPGLGKTHLAVSILKALILEREVECKFVDFFQLLSDIRHGYSNDLSEQALINPYVNAPVLVIDELAKGRNTEWEQTMLDQIITSRYNAADRVTLFTSNHEDNSEESQNRNNSSTDGRINLSKSYAEKVNPATLSERLGPRIYSRLTEMCRFVKLEGEDYRPNVVVHTRAKPHLKHSA
ncbi:MAG: ATP-binding protein [Candidatus Nitronauta litoralis]|uniref:ATP-binding protein n=1 Tax=Candidatus Nitronauta litoralis TaxID=2705533 RepID=A0A7T0BUP1_9BACT|nr:MAG: ATP-binding protein [Candidatus Nitronauta litoralis]